MPLQDQLDAFKAEFESGGPPYNVPRAVIDAFHRSTDELVASGQAQRARQAGDLAPSFTLPDSEGRQVSLESLLHDGPLVLTFYRGNWCPYCNMEMAALQGTLPEITQRGASLVSVSPQTAANARKSVRQHNLTFPMLVDAGGNVADAFGLRWKFSDEMIGVYTKMGVALPAINGDESWTLPMPARYVIDQHGVIAYAEINPDYTRRPDPVEVLPVLDLLASRVGA